MRLAHFLSGWRMLIRRVALAAVFLNGLFIGTELRSDDWPQWRGANRDGVWRETGIVDAVPATGLKVSWRARIGRGYSGPVVAEGRVFVTDQVFEPEVERVLCFDETTGQVLWTHAYAVNYKDMEYGNGPRASPTVHDGRVYTLGTQGDLCCLDAATGRLHWQKDLEQEYDARIPRYGASVSPLVEGDVLIVCIGGQPNASVIAFDRIAGEERWKTLDDEAGYSAPIVVERGGCRQVVVWTAERIVSMNPVSGEVYWDEKWKASFDAAQVLATPVLRDDRLLFVMAWNRGSKMLQLEADKPAASLLWQTRSRPTTMMSTPMMIDEDYFYSIDNVGGLCCQKADSGDEVWRTDEVAGNSPNSNAHLTPNGDRVFLFNQRGQLISARISPNGYEETGRTLLVEPTAAFRAQGPLVWSHPAFANKHVIARNDRLLVRASLAADDYSAIDAQIGNAETKPRILADFTGRNSALALTYSPNGQNLAVATWSGKVWQLDIATGNEINPPLPPFRNTCVGVTYSRDGKLLAYVGGSEFEQGGDLSRTAKVMLWDLTANVLRGDLPGHTSLVTSAAFSPDGNTLATGSADRTIQLWDTNTKQVKAVLKGHTDAVWTLAYIDDTTLVSAGWDHTLRFWNPATGEETSTLTGHEGEILSLAVSPDGKTLATGSGDWTVRLWDTTTRKSTATLKGHTGSVYAVAFSPDGETIASGSGDETVRLWSVAGENEQSTLRGHQSGISAVAFSPDGGTLASAGRDDPVRLWKLTSAD